MSGGHRRDEPETAEPETVTAVFVIIPEPECPAVGIHR